MPLDARVLTVIADLLSIAAGSDDRVETPEAHSCPPQQKDPVIHRRELIATCYVTNRPHSPREELGKVKRYNRPCELSSGFDINVALFLSLSLSCALKARIAHYPTEIYFSRSALYD